jgi:hypothetical protein
MARYTSVPAETAQLLDLTSGGTPIYLNLLIDAATITDATTGVIEVSGDISIAFITLGDD